MSSWNGSEAPARSSAVGFLNENELVDVRGLVPGPLQKCLELELSEGEEDRTPELPVVVATVRDWDIDRLCLCCNWIGIGGRGGLG